VGTRLALWPGVFIKLKNPFFPIVCQLALFFTLGLIPPPAQAKVYTIEKDHNFADGTIYIDHWFRGTKLNFSAAFNESNIYTITPEDQSDINKLYGFSDCKMIHQKSSARFGWRWLNNQLQILGFTHYGGTWHATEVLGVAELNRPYDFTIELSEDKTQVLYTFNHGKPVATARECNDSEFFGYMLAPYFGGTSTSPHDMTLSVWEEPRANFAIEKAGPNPLHSGEPFHLWYWAGETMDVVFQVYDLQGRAVYRSQVISVSGSLDTQNLSITLPEWIPAGIYLLRPFRITADGTLAGYVLTGTEESLRISKF